MSLGPSSLTGENPDTEDARLGAEMTFVRRRRTAGDEAEALPDGYFRGHWDSEFDLHTPMPMFRQAVPPLLGARRHPLIRF